jgi:hypothetical protein
MEKNQEEDNGKVEEEEHTKDMNKSLNFLLVSLDLLQK